MTRNTLTIDRLREALDYNVDTGIFVWKIRPSKLSRRRAGDLAGGVKVIAGTARRYIGIDGVDYVASRLAWFYAKGMWPTMRLGFIDGDSDNLAIANLVEMPGALGKFDHGTPEGRLAYQRAHRAAYPMHYRGKDLVKHFGIDLAEYQRMFVAQGGVCACCGKPETETRGGKVKWLAVDHDHATGAVRGLLCTGCNTGLGKFGDSIELLTSAIAYLKRYAPAVAAADNVVPLTKKDSG